MVCTPQASCRARPWAPTGSLGSPRSVFLLRSAWSVELASKLLISSSSKHRKEGVTQMEDQKRGMLLRRSPRLCTTSQWCQIGKAGASRILLVEWHHEFRIATNRLGWICAKTWGKLPRSCRVATMYDYIGLYAFAAVDRRRPAIPQRTIS